MAKNVMTGIAEGDDNDWKPLNENGFMQTEADINIVRQQVDARVKTLPNEVDGFEAIDYFNVIFNDRVPMMVKIQSIITAIETVPAVSDVSYTNVQWLDRVGGVLKMDFSVNTIFGQLNYGMSIDQENKGIQTAFQ